MPNWKKVVVSGSDAVLSSVTSSFTGSLTGALIGTASWAQSASRAISASYAPPSPTFPYIGTATISGSLLVTGSSFLVTSDTTQINASNEVQIATTRVSIGDNTGPPEKIFLRSNTGNGGLFWTLNDEQIAVYAENDRYNYGNGNMYVSSSDQKTYSPAGFIGPLTGSVFGTASWATSVITSSVTSNVDVNDVPNSNTTNYLAFYLNASGFRPSRIASTKFVVNPATGSMGINKSTITTGYNLDVSGSVLVTGSITASLGFFGTASFATSASQALTASQATSASYALSASFAPSSPAFPYTGSAIISGSLGITGSLIVSGTNGGIDTSLNSPALLSGDGNQAVVFGTNRKWLNDANSTTVVDWEVQSLNDSLANPSIDWTNRILYEVGGYEALNYSTSASVSSQLYYNNVIPGQVQRQLANTPTHAGQVIQASIDVGVSNYELVALDTDGVWKPTKAAVGYYADKMLGIAVDAAGGYVLIEGDIGVSDDASKGAYVVGADYGLPVYVSTSDNQMTTTAPSGAGSIVRIVGHIYYNSTTDVNWWTMKFRPSNDWYII